MRSVAGNNAGQNHHNKRHSDGNTHAAHAGNNAGNNKTEKGSAAPVTSQVTTNIAARAHHAMRCEAAQATTRPVTTKRGNDTAAVTHTLHTQVTTQVTTKIVMHNAVRTRSFRRFRAVSAILMSWLTHVYGSRFTLSAHGCVHALFGHQRLKNYNE